MFSCSDVRPTPHVGMTSAFKPPNILRLNCCLCLHVELAAFVYQLQGLVGNGELIICIDLFVFVKWGMLRYSFGRIESGRSEDPGVRGFC